MNSPLLFSHPDLCKVYAKILGHDEGATSSTPIKAYLNPEIASLLQNQKFVEAKRLSQRHSSRLGWLLAELNIAKHSEKHTTIDKLWPVCLQLNLKHLKAHFLIYEAMVSQQKVARALQAKSHHHQQASHTTSSSVIRDINRESAIRYYNAGELLQGTDNEENGRNSLGNLCYFLSLKLFAQVAPDLASRSNYHSYLSMIQKCVDKLKLAKKSLIEEDRVTENYFSGLFLKF